MNEKHQTPSNITLKQLITPLGPMLAGSIRDVEPKKEQLCLLVFADGKRMEAQQERLGKLTGARFVSGDSPLLTRLQLELDEYFGGKGQEFSVPLFYPGTEFQRQVWEVLRTIPYGETRSYTEQAAAFGRPKAVRAAARANGNNRIAILIPCHRVIGSDGSLTGYSGGLWRKEFLLDLERGEKQT